MCSFCLSVAVNEIHWADLSLRYVLPVTGTWYNEEYVKQTMLEAEGMDWLAVSADIVADFLLGRAERQRHLVEQKGRDIW